MKLQPIALLILLTLPGIPVPGGAQELAPLEVRCSVVAADAAAQRLRVSWESPAHEPFAVVRVEAEGQVLATAPWTDSFLDVDNDRPGVVTITVDALLRPGDTAAAASASCEVTGVFAPRVTCDREGGSNVIRWEAAHPGERWTVYKNGEPATSLDGGATSFVDPAPSAGGADAYAVAAVLGAVEGPPGRCRGPDPDPCRTASPVPVGRFLGPRPRPSSPNVLRFRWRNGEAYDRLLAFLRFVPLAGGEAREVFSSGGRALDPHSSELVYDGGGLPGGAPPGSYTLRLRGFRRLETGDCPGQVGEAASDLVAFEPLSAPLPDLDDVAFTAARVAVDDLRLSWLPTWGGYDDLVLRLEQASGGAVVNSWELDPHVLPAESGRLVRDFEPLGTYTATLAGHLGEGPEPLEVATTTQIVFSPRLILGSVETGIGMSGFDVPVVASGVFRTVTGARFMVEHPDHLAFEGFSSTPVAPGRRRTTVFLVGLNVDPDPDGDLQATGTVLLETLRARVDEDFSLADRVDSLQVAGAGMRFLGHDEYRDVPAESGRVTLRDEYLSVDRRIAVAGSADPVRVAVRVAFRAPPGELDYGVAAFTIHLSFEYEKLRLLPVSLEDQAETAIGGLGTYFLPPPHIVDRANETGDVTVGWLGFDFANPDQFIFLEPVIDEQLLVLRFLPRVAADAPETFARIAFVADPEGENPTEMFLEEGDPRPPPQPSFFQGGVLIRPARTPPRVVSIQPSHGALFGGNTITVRGRDLSARNQAPQVRFIGPSGTSTAPTVEVVASNEVRVVVPDSGLRPPFSGASTFFAVQVETGGGVVRIEDAYHYDTPRLDAAEPASVEASSGSLLLRGAGLPGDAVVTVEVDGDSFPTTTLRAADDGSELLVITPRLPEPCPGEEIAGHLRVTLPAATGALHLGLGEPLRIVSASSERPRFVRGDANADGLLNLSDGVSVLSHLFRAGSLPCRSSADADDNGLLLLTDGVYILNHLFRGGPQPRPPADGCGCDPTPDALDCETFAPCE